MDCNDDNDLDVDVDVNDDDVDVDVNDVDDVDVEDDDCELESELDETIGSNIMCFLRLALCNLASKTSMSSYSLSILPLPLQ